MTALFGLKFMTSNKFSFNGGIWCSMIANYFYRKYFYKYFLTAERKTDTLIVFEMTFKGKNTKILSGFGTMPNGLRN